MIFSACKDINEYNSGQWKKATLIRYITKNLRHTANSIGANLVFALVVNGQMVNWVDGDGRTQGSPLQFRQLMIMVTHVRH